MESKCMLVTVRYFTISHVGGVAHLVTGFPRLLENSGKSWTFYWKISMTLKVFENDLGTGKSWKSTCKVLESPGNC